MFKIHDYLSDSRHKTFFQMNIKYDYFSVVLHLNNCYLFAFSISEIRQLQLTQMSQKSQSADFTMSEFMNITLESISEPQSKSFLMHKKLTELTSIAFYMNDLFSDHSDFELQFAFLQDQFFLWIEWVKLTLSFRKFWLFVNHIKVLRVEHYVSEKLHVLSVWVEIIVKWLKLINVKNVWGFLKVIDIICQWVKNFAEIVRPLNWLTESVLWRWTQSEQLFFEILQIKCAISVVMNDIDWSLNIHFYSDVSDFISDLVITQFQKVEERSKSVEILIIYDTLTFSVTEWKY